MTKLSDLLGKIKAPYIPKPSRAYPLPEPKYSTEMDLLQKAKAKRARRRERNLYNESRQHG